MTAINAAKSRLNGNIETLYPVGGQILKLAQPHSQQICNLAYRKMQEFLASLKYSGVEQEIAFTGATSVPAITVNDPLVQVWMSYSNYFDGTTQQASPVLPQSLIRPYQLWERASGSAVLLTEMDEVINGLPSVPKMPWNRQWEWRDDVLYMPGATVVTDIRMRYGSYFADFADNSPTAATPWYAQPILVMRSVDALADYICREVEIARQNPDAAMAFQASAEANARLLVGRDTTQAQATGSAAQLGKMQDRYTAVAGKPKTEKR
jgi:hypothetical protein